jgi:hypothetical protein
MADPNTPVGRLQTVANQIAGFDLELLIKPAQGGTYNFEPHREFIKFILNFYADVGSLELSHVPQPVVDQMINQANSILNVLNAIKQFNYRNGDPNQQSASLIAQLQNQWREVYNFAISHVAFAKISSSAIAQELETIKAVVNQMRSDWAKAAGDYKAQKEAADKNLAGRISEFEKVLAAAREASGKEAVSRQAREFETEAHKCLIASRLWFAATICVIVASLVTVYVMFLKDLHKPLTTAITQSVTTSTNQLQVMATHAANADEATTLNHAITIEALQQTVARILIITLLYSVVVWVARNYFANRHNYTVNRHRRNAMQTFRAFVEGTEDKATQDFILRQAAACAFAPQQTGYLKDESLPAPAPSSPIIDIVRPSGS